MPVALQLDNELKGGGTVTDTNGTLSCLALSAERAGIGGAFGTASFSILEFGAGESTLLFLRRDTTNAEGDPALNVSFKLDPTNRVFHLDVGGQNNSDARIHLGDAAKGDNRVTMLGAVGIGTTEPTEMLEVHGNIVATGDVRLAGADCAEDFRIEDLPSVEPGMVMVIGDEERLLRCTEAYDKRVAGVLSGAGAYRPGIVLGKEADDGERLPLALTGRVYCYVDADYSAVAIGDLLTTSRTPGFAMKASDHDRAFGAVVGKALRGLESGRGLIPILVSRQ